MRTTITLDDALYRQAVDAADRHGRTLSDLVAEGLREVLLRSKVPVRSPSQLPTVGGRGLRPGLDLDNLGSILDQMDEPDAAPAGRIDSGA
ncbi:MAG: type II toxin-antitoxin system VapB family antitoxin [Actinomycetota bacterium]|nr:type II toxin-antitoxin system VapB family antitoxin [Actinomycetota bacterium]